MLSKVLKGWRWWEIDRMLTLNRYREFHTVQLNGMLTQWKSFLLRKLLEWRFHQVYKSSRNIQDCINFQEYPQFGMFTEYSRFRNCMNLRFLYDVIWSRYKKVDLEKGLKFRTKSVTLIYRWWAKVKSHVSSENSWIVNLFDLWMFHKNSRNVTSPRKVSNDNYSWNCRRPGWISTQYILYI